MSQNMSKSKRLRGRNMFTGASAAAVAAGLSGGAHAGDADRHRLELAFGVSRLNIDTPTETFEPFWAGDWDDTKFELPLSAPNGDLGADLGRELRLRFRPRNSAWSFGIGVRSGSASQSIDIQRTERGAPEFVAWTGGPPYPSDFGISSYSSENPDFVSVFGERHEEFGIVDFEVGKDVGLGFLREGGESRVSFGLRYARFESETTQVDLDGQNRYDPEPPTVAEFFAAYYAGTLGDLVKYQNADVFEADFDSRREFEGWGPAASWTASQPLFGNERAGRVLLDWTLGGGVLFGKQETRVDYGAASRYYSWPAIVSGSGDPPGTGDPQAEESGSASHDREDRVTVPFLNLDLGLSYKLERMRVSLGYRFEKYFDAIDGGVDEQKSYDRSFRGPYLRFTVGLFGGEEE